MANNTTVPFIDKINAIYGMIIALLSYVLGEHWFLFVGYFGLNIVDLLTGCLKSRINGVTSSAKGATGILKKLGYWLMIMVAFGMSSIFIEIGLTIGVDLRITSMIGWFVLASLIINEIRSIIENFVEAGYQVPNILVKGLEVANKAIDGTVSISKEHGDLIFDVPNEAVQNKNRVVLQVEKDNKKKQS